jgi:hypothetical protein
LRGRRRLGCGLRRRRGRGRGRRRLLRNRSRCLWRRLDRRCRGLRGLRLRRKCLGGRHHPQDNQANRFAGHSHEDTRIVPILRDPPRSISLVLQTKCHLTNSLCGSRLQRLEKRSLMSSRAKRGICFFANRKKKADSTGNPRPRNHKFGIFPQTVQPRQSDDFKTWVLLRAAFLMSYVYWPFSAIFEAFWAEGGGH